MASKGSGAQMQACPGCGQPVETTGLEPFGKVNCPACGVPLRVERTFENYVVIEPLGTGGMGSVYKVRDTRLDRFVALKLLRKEFAGDAAFTAKLKEEARITASIKHPHVIEVYAVGEDHGQFYVVMELVDGGSLDDRIEDEKRISEKAMLEVGLQVASGLQAALQAGLIHRDIKPGNILFADRNSAKIVDFGLALLAAQHAETEGEIWGTPFYVAPERLTNSKEDFRSDLYSLGATLFHAVAGRPTFEDETQSAAELNRLKANPIGLREVARDVSAESAAVIDKMLRPSPADRHGSYQELIAELENAHAAVLAREEELSRRWSWPKRIVVSLGTLLLLVALGFAISLGVHRLPKRESAAEASVRMEAAGAQNLQLQLAPARRELEAGHYAAAEPLFREIALTEPKIQPAAELCAALQFWERGQFAQAATALQRFVNFKPPSELDWLNNYKSLARERLHDYDLYRAWEKKGGSSADPEIALARTRAVVKKLKAKGALAFQMADEEAKLAAGAAEAAERRAAEEKKRAVADKQRAKEEEPRWQAARAAEGKAMVAYEFEKALGIIEATKLSAASLQAERADELRRVRWLADWKAKLISDINGIGFGGVVTDIHGVRYDGPVRRATPDKIEFKTRYGSVMTSWLNLSPPTLLGMSTAFIRLQAGELAERQWLSAIFAGQTGQMEKANELARAAAEAKPEFRALLPKFFPAAKK